MNSKKTKIAVVITICFSIMGLVGCAGPVSIPNVNNNSPIPLTTTGQ